jgi:peptidyl-dipeptidase Dcp
VGAALLDLDWHLLDEEKAARLESVEDFEKAALERHGFMDEIGPRYRSAHFQHIFTGDGYSAGYYVYLWAQVLEADAFEEFRRAGDVFHPDLAERLRDQVFSTGAARDEMTSYQRFLGRLPRVEALVAKQGLGA